jgi:hypothetical protein
MKTITMTFSLKDAERVRSALLARETYLAEQTEHYASFDDSELVNQYSDEREQTKKVRAFLELKISGNLR